MRVLLDSSNLIIWVFVSISNMWSKDIVMVSSESDILSRDWRCPFSFCPRFEASLRNCSTLRDHISGHLMRSRSECLSGRGLMELDQHLREHGRWLCGRCSKTYREGSRCHICRVSFVVFEGFSCRRVLMILF